MFTMNDLSSEVEILQALKEVCDNRHIPRFAPNTLTEGLSTCYVKNDALEYIARTANGNKGWAIRLLETCLREFPNVTLDDAVQMCSCLQ